MIEFWTKEELEAVLGPSIVDGQVRVDVSSAPGGPIESTHSNRILRWSSCACVGNGGGTTPGEFRLARCPKHANLKKQ